MHTVSSRWHMDIETHSRTSSSNYLNVCHVTLGAKKVCVVEGRGSLCGPDASSVETLSHY